MSRPAFAIESVVAFVRSPRGFWGIWTVVVSALYAWLSHDQVPKLFPDSGAYFQIAEQPLSIEALFYRKPPTVPLVFRWLDCDPDAIARLQRWLLLGCHLAWVWSAATVVTTRQGRVALALVGAVTLLAPIRIGTTALILSEAINDSLGAALLAIWILLLRPDRNRARSLRLRRWLPAVAFSCLVLLWLFARDTNALVALIACGVAFVATVRRRRHRHHLCLGGVVVALALLSLYTGQRTPPGYTGGKFTPGWEATVSRGAVTQVQVFFLRVLPDADAVAHYRSRGMPWSERLDPHVGSGEVAMTHSKLPQHYKELVRSSDLQPTIDWLHEHATSAYASWLAAHPLQTAAELLGNLRYLVWPEQMASYMPPGWRAWEDDPWFLSWRSWTERLSIVFALLLSSTILLGDPRRSPLSLIALAVLAGGLVGIAAAFYGDGIEITRHVHPHVQQITLALLLAAVGRVERSVRLSPAPADPEPAPPTR